MEADFYFFADSNLLMPQSAAQAFALPRGEAELHIDSFAKQAAAVERHTRSLTRTTSRIASERYAFSARRS